MGRKARGDGSEVMVKHEEGCFVRKGSGNGDGSEEALKNEKGLCWWSDSREEGRTYRCT